MDIQVVGGTESLCAGGTLVGLFTSVDLLVSLEVGDLSEGFVAAGVGTLVWFLSCVDSQVLLQRRVLGERLSTSVKGTYLHFLAGVGGSSGITLGSNQACQDK
jgi:hypothetical protein